MASVSRPLRLRRTTSVPTAPPPLAVVRWAACHPLVVLDVALVETRMLQHRNFLLGPLVDDMRHFCHPHATTLCHVADVVDATSHSTNIPKLAVEIHGFAIQMTIKHFD